MNLSIGIVGLPNVGKSTLFNALTKQKVLAENYPFATIDPNHGVVAVPDERLEKIAEIEKPGKVIHATVDFVDIAGIVKGASEGQGLGNQFLANIREVNAIAQVVRAFENSKITHVEDSVDPARDVELINTELLLKDIEGLEKKISDLERRFRADAKMLQKVEYIKRLGEHIQSGKLARDFEQTKDEDAIQMRKELFLLTDKPIIYIVNSSVGNFEKDIESVRKVINENDSVIAMDIKIESEIAELEGEERDEFMSEFEMNKSGLEILAEEAYSTLGLISFFTSGPMESRAWTIKKGDSAPKAAGAIHTDIQNNFIAADVVTTEDFIAGNGWQGAKEKGKVRLEGKDYIMQDGDVVLFKHNG